MFSQTKMNPCKAKVRQLSERFDPGPHGHNHPAQVGAAIAAKVISRVKSKAKGDVFRPAPAIVDEVSSVEFCEFSIMFAR